MCIMSERAKYHCYLGTLQGLLTEISAMLVYTKSPASEHTQEFTPNIGRYV